MMTKTYKQALLQGQHALTDTFKMALYSASATLNEDTTAYSPTNEIKSSGYTPGGCTLANPTVSADGTGFKLDFDAFTYTNCAIVCRYALLYNVTKGKAVAVKDYGSDVGVVSSGTFVVDASVKLD